MGLCCGDGWMARVFVIRHVFMIRHNLPRLMRMARVFMIRHNHGNIGLFCGKIAVFLAENLGSVAEMWGSFSEI